MRAAVISFTQNGNACNRRIITSLKMAGYEAKGFYGGRYQEKGHPEKDILRPAGRKVSEWTKEAFSQNDALIFVGATAIAVRSIAPCLKDKLTDPAVLVVDEKGQYVIPLLSGHVGGANELAVRLATDLKALPVITTATDIQGLFAVDVFAVKNQLILTDRRKAKEISAAILEHEWQQVYVDSVMKYEKVLPKYLQIADDAKTADIIIDYHQWPDDIKGLQLIPEKAVWLGIGCRKGTEAVKIREAVNTFLTKHAIDERAIAGLASIDVKAEEAGILEVCQERKWPFVTFSAEKLCAQKGDFTASAFVKSHVGVDNVCERASLCAADEACRYNNERQISSEARSNNDRQTEAVLLIRKEIMPGITLAAAGTGRRLRFE